MYTYLGGGAHAQGGRVEAGLQALDVHVDVARHTAIQRVLDEAVHELQAVAAAHGHLVAVRY